MKRLLVCGSRNFRDYALMDETLSGIYVPGTILIHGCEELGADYLSEEWWRRQGFDPDDIRRFPAKWKTHGKLAGPIRNADMLREGRPTDVVAFPMPGSVGTWDMVTKTRVAAANGAKINLTVIEQQ